MNRNAFRQLLKRYLDNSCTEDEKRIVDQWYELLDNGSSILSDTEIGEVEDRLWNKIQSAAINNLPVQTIERKKIVWWKYAVAASLIGVAFLVGRGLFQNTKETPANHSLVTAKLNEGFLNEVNKSDSAKTITLEDGSTVLLYPGSKLAFPKHFAANREVYLDGDAFFTVTKKANRPFFVYSNKIVTQVLGTSFTVHGKGGQVEVAVKTGQVAVYENKEQISLSDAQQKSNGVIVTPNQKVTYYVDLRHFITSIIDQPLPVPAEPDQGVAEPRFNYNEAPLLQVLKDLETAYKLEIILENEKLKNCAFTGDLTGQSLFNRLEGICLVFNASYEIKGTKILLTRGKCT